METAGQEPTAGSTVAVAPDLLEQRNGHISASEAARYSGVNRHELAELVREGLIRGLIDESDGRRPCLYIRGELDEDLSRLPRCRYEGCARFSRGRNGGCTKHDDILARRLCVVELRRAGLSTPAIGNELGVSPTTVCEHLKALGLDSSAQGRWPDLISGSEAARRHPINRHTLVLAAEAGIVRAYRVKAPGLGPNGVAWFFDPDELVEDLERLPTCAYEGCDQRVLGPSGGCEAHGHVLTGARALGVKRPDIGPKISARKMGRPRPDQAERMRTSFKTGGKAARALVERMSGPRVRRKFKLRWAPKPGPHKSYSEDQAQAVRAMKKSHPTWGYRTLAAQNGLSVKVVRGILTP